MTTWVYALLLAVGLVLLAVTALRLLLGGLAGPPGRAMTVAVGARALEILDERYATGELSREEYQHRMRVLEGG